MGFFQDLKEDLSMAVNELIPEADSETENLEGQAADKEQTDATVLVDEDIFRAAVDRLDENADIFAEESDAEEEAAVAGEEAEAMAEIKTAEADAVQMTEPEAADMKADAKEQIQKAKQEVKDEEEEAAAQADDLIKEVCKEIENSNEETELEKEVSKIMTQQNERELTGEVADETAVVTNGMTVTGDVNSRGSMDVLGKIKGNIEILGKLNISGEVEGNSIAAEVFADSAKIMGEIHAQGSVKVGQSSVIIGNIFATSAVVAGAVKGDIDVQGPVVLDTSAIVMGNIKSKSVQINNGAVIEGMCSQCYADVNPASFFQDLNK